jgi:hypothetical protein
LTTLRVEGDYENIFIILHFKRSNINTMWKSEVNNFLMQRSSRFQDFCTDDTIFDSKKILVNQYKICSNSFLQ